MQIMSHLSFQKKKGSYSTTVVNSAWWKTRWQFCVWFHYCRGGQLLVYVAKVPSHVRCRKAPECVWGQDFLWIYNGYFFKEEFCMKAATSLDLGNSCGSLKPEIRFVLTTSYIPTWRTLSEFVSSFFCDQTHSSWIWGLFRCCNSYLAVSLYLKH